jgi:hypothetical protein
VSSLDGVGGLLAGLLEILDGEVRLLLGQPDDVRLLIGLPRLLALLGGDPRLSSAVSVLREAVRNREREFNRYDEATLQEIRTLWRGAAHLFQDAHQAAKARGEEATFQALGRLLPSFEAAFDEKPEATFPADEEIGRDPSRSGALLKLLGHWHRWIPEAVDRERVGGVLQRLRERHDYEYRRLWLDGRNLGGIAFARLETHAISLNPPPPARGGPDDRLTPIVRAVFEPQDAPEDDQTGLGVAAQSIRRDVALLHQAMRTALILGSPAAGTPAPKSRTRRSSSPA